MMDPLSVYCLADFASLEERVREVLGSGYSLDSEYQQKIEEGADELTPVRNFNLGLLRDYNSDTRNPELTELREYISDYVKKKKDSDADDVIRHMKLLDESGIFNVRRALGTYSNRRLDLTPKYLDRLFSSRNIILEGVLNPGLVKTSGLCVFVNCGKKYLLISDLKLIDGVRRFDSVWPERINKII